MRDPFKPPAGARPAWRDRLVAFCLRSKWRGAVRLYSLLKPLAARRQLRVATRFGSQFFLSPWDHVDTCVIDEGFYESEVLEAILPALALPGATLWVVGANFGLHAVTAKFLCPTASVIAFEPSPAMGSRLIEHCELNRLTIDLHAYALSSANAALPFYANASGNPGMSTLHPEDPARFDHRFFVATLTASEAITRGLAPAPTAMILDAEGAETDVLRGFGPLLASPHLRLFVFEADNDFIARRAPAELYALVTAAGFTLRKLNRNERTAHNLSNFAAYRA